MLGGLGTSLTEGIPAGVGSALATAGELRGILIYVTAASVVSATLGAVVLPKLFPSHTLTCPEPPPCACLCASTCVPSTTP